MYDQTKIKIKSKNKAVILSMRSYLTLHLHILDIPQFITEIHPDKILRLPVRETQGSRLTCQSISVHYTSAIPYVLTYKKRPHVFD